MANPLWRLLWVPAAVAGVLFAGCGSDEETGSIGDEATSSPVGATPQERVCREDGSTTHIPFMARVVLPSEAPEGMTLTKACWTNTTLTDLESATFTYENSEKTKNLIVATANVPVDARDRPTLSLADVTAFVDDLTRTDGTQLYTVEFARGVRAYSVIAVMGPANAITREEVNAVALLLVEATAGG